jgi:uncharacterized integral membrane protein (TIGR00697 family)
MKADKARYSFTFLVLFSIFITCLLISNIIAGKLILVLGMVLPSAVILFPITYILGDVFTEVYGYAKTRSIIWVGFAANALMSAIFMIAVALPHPDFFKDQSAYATVLGLTPRIVAASLIAYWSGEFANSISLSILKKATKGRFLWVRTIGSTVVGQILDTVLFIGISFVGSVPAAVLLQMIVAQYLFKVAYEVVLTPVTYRVVRLIKKIEGIDTFDHGVAYNPFKLGAK